MKLEITKVGHEQCLPLRQAVLWPDFPVEHSLVQGDADADHYAVSVGNQIICCLSVFTLSADVYQVRKFATAIEHQGKGHGTVLLNHVISALQALGATAITLSARETAQVFYQRFGFKSVGDRFERDGIHFMTMTLTFTAL